MIDIHSHVLPGLDDGARDMDESIRMCTIAAEDGIAKMVASPHHLNGAYYNMRDKIIEAVASLNNALSANSIDLTVLPGADLHLCSALIEELKDGRAMTIADGGKFILLELPAFFVPTHVKEQAFRLKLMGITPVITHPERNNIAMEDPDFLYDLVVAGSLLQVTAGSITGDFGSTVRERCHRLLQHGMIHVVSSDAHDSRSRTPLLSKALKVITEEIGPAEARMTVIDRPASILAGKMPETVRPKRPKKHHTILSMLGIKRRKW